MQPTYLYIVVEVDYAHKEIRGVFDTLEQARALAATHPLYEVERAELNKIGFTEWVTRPRDETA